MSALSHIWPLGPILQGMTPQLWAAGLIYAAAYAVGILAFALMARRRGLDTEGVRSVSLVALIGGLVGANDSQWLLGGEAGKTILGGIASGYLAVVLYKRHIGLRRPLGDLFAVALAAGEAVGRWGCFVGGCCYGRVVAHSALPWSVYQHGAYRHPAQAYLSLASFAILGTLLWREYRRPLPENGLFFLQGMLCCAARFEIEFFREGSILANGLTLAQWVCLVGFVFFAVRFRLLVRSADASPIASLSPVRAVSYGPVSEV